MKSHDLPSDGKPKARATVASITRRVYSIKGLEDVIEGIRRNPWTLILDHEIRRPGAVTAKQADQHLSIWDGIFHRITNDIFDCAPKQIKRAARRARGAFDKTHAPIHVDGFKVGVAATSCTKAFRSIDSVGAGWSRLSKRESVNSCEINASRRSTSTSMRVRDVGASPSC